MRVAVNRDRAVAIIASTGMILTWLANAASPRPEPALSSPPSGARAERVVPDAASALAFDVEREAERLRLRVADAPAPRRSGRNPFRFVERRAPGPSRPLRPAPAASESDAAADRCRQCC